jgi:hypothetical protein
MPPFILADEGQQWVVSGPSALLRGDGSYDDGALFQRRDLNGLLRVAEGASSGAPLPNPR